MSTPANPPPIELDFGTDAPLPVDMVPIMRGMTGDPGDVGDMPDLSLLFENGLV